MCCPVTRKNKCYLQYYPGVFIKSMKYITVQTYMKFFYKHFKINKKYDILFNLIWIIFWGIRSTFINYLKK